MQDRIWGFQRTCSPYSIDRKSVALFGTKPGPALILWAEKMEMKEAGWARGQLSWALLLQLGMMSRLWTALSALQIIFPHSPCYCQTGPSGIFFLIITLCIFCIVQKNKINWVECVRYTLVFLGAIFLTVIDRFTGTGGTLKVRDIILQIYYKKK